MFVVAMPDEVKLIDSQEDYIVTGVGAINVINALKDIDRDTEIINVGYAGSNVIPIGTVVRVGESTMHHPSVQYDEPIYKLDGTVKCFTSSDFVSFTDIKEPCVFDMELAYILALGFKNVKSIKHVSDNLSVKEFEECLKK